MAEVNRARADRIGARKGHVADDSECRYWAGDFAGVDLRARCYPCRDGAEGLTGPSVEQASRASAYYNALLVYVGGFLAGALVAWLVLR